MSLEEALLPEGDENDRDVVADGELVVELTGGARGFNVDVELNQSPNDVAFSQRVALHGVADGISTTTAAAVGTGWNAEREKLQRRIPATLNIKCRIVYSPIHQAKFYSYLSWMGRVSKSLWSLSTNATIIPCSVSLRHSSRVSELYHRPNPKPPTPTARSKVRIQELESDWGSLSSRLA